VVTDTVIPMTIYDKLMFTICEEYDVKLRRVASISKNLIKNRYELPTDDKKIRLRMGGINVYISKTPQDLFDIEYNVEFKINAKQFTKIVNRFMNKNGYNVFDFENYIDKDEMLTNLANYINNKYNIKSHVYHNGGYIQIDVKVFMHTDTRVLYVE